MGLIKYKVKHTDLVEYDGPCSAFQEAVYIARGVDAQMESMPDAKPLDEWHEANGPVVWWYPPVREPSWIGTPNDSDWPGYHTHWTPHPKVPANIKERT